MMKEKQKSLIKYCMKYQRGGRINNAVKNIGWALNHCQGSEEAHFDADWNPCSRRFRSWRVQ